MLEESFNEQGKGIQVRLLADSVKDDLRVESDKSESTLPRIRKVSVKLEIQRAGKKIFVPQHVLASLHDPITISIKNLNPTKTQISVRGGDASNAYVARILVDADRVLKLELFEMGSDHPIYTTTYYQQVIE